MIYNDPPIFYITILGMILENSYSSKRAKFDDRGVQPIS